MWLHVGVHIAQIGVNVPYAGTWRTTTLQSGPSTLFILLWLYRILSRFVGNYTSEPRVYKAKTPRPYKTLELINRTNMVYNCYKSGQDN
jgi:hypothetical protein